MLDPYTARLFQIESGGNPNAVTGSNSGLGQFGPSEQRQFGITDWRDPDQQVAAVGRERDYFHPILSKVLGREPTPGELYLTHQQGVAGGPALLTANPTVPAWQAIRPYYNSDAIAQKAITGNIPKGSPLYGADANSITAGDFSNFWKNKFENGGKGFQPSSTLAFNGSDPGPVASSPAQGAITKAMAGNNNDNSQLPVGARPVMFQGNGQSQDGNGLFSILKGNSVPDTGLGRVLGMGNVGSAIGAIGRGLVTAANPAAGAALQSANFQQQMLMGGDLQSVGTDMFGHPIMAWVNKMTHSITPATMGAGGGAGSSGDAGSGSGTGSLGGMGSNINEGTVRQLQSMDGTPEDKLAVLQKMSPAAYSVVQGLRNGSESINLLPRQGEGRAGWIALAQAVDPNFKGESDYASRVAQAKAETSSGVFGKNNKSADQLMGHLDQLDQKIDAAHLSKYPDYNKAANFLSEHLGNEQAQSSLGALRSAAEAPAQELVALMRNNGGAEADIKAWRDQFNAAESPASMKSALRQGVNTMHSIIAANVNQHNRIFHENKSVNDYLSKDSQAVISRLLGGGAAPQGSAAAPSVSEGATATGPNGHKIVFSKGGWVDAQTGQPLQ